MLSALFALGSSCKAAVGYNLNIYGQQAKIPVTENHCAYFSITFGDFGHTVDVYAKANGVKVPVYYNYGFKCPTNETLVKGSILYDDPSQIAQFCAYTENATYVDAFVLSGVRPIAINSSMTLIYSFFIFFAINFLVAGILQFFYFKNAMNPNEYIAQEDLD